MRPVSHRSILAALNPFTRLRSIEERVGLIGFTLALLFVMSQSLMAHEFKAGDLEIDHPWSRATPDGAKVAAGYLTIKNNGTTPDRLVSATGVIAGKTEIHEMSVDAKGTMTMRPLADGVAIPAGGSFALEPGSYHIMFMNLKEGARQGQPFKGSLTFEKAGTVEVEFAVEAVGGKPAVESHDGQQGHDGHGG